MPELYLDIDRPAVTVVEINDPTIADQGIELIDQDAVQLTSNPFRARRVVVRLEGGVIVYHSTNHRIRTRTKTQQGWLAYVTFSPLAKGTVNGLPIHSELVLAVEPETEVGIRHQRGAREHFDPAPDGGHSRASPRPAPGGRIPDAAWCRDAAGGSGHGPSAFRLGDTAGAHGRTPTLAVQRPEGGKGRRPGRDGRDASGDPRC